MRMPILTVLRLHTLLLIPPNPLGHVAMPRGTHGRLALTKVNGMLLNGKQVFVGYFERRANRLELHKTKFTTRALLGVEGPSTTPLLPPPGGGRGFDGTSENTLGEWGGPSTSPTLHPEEMP